VEFQILGPVEVIDDAGERLPVGGPKPRAVLAMLLLSRGRVVSRDRLLEGLWGDRAPPSAEHTLDDYLSRLRRLLGDDRLIRRPPGYALTLHDGELDLARFERLRENAHGQPPADAAQTLRASLAL
jgi:DNA-binding SARP family transcriptional activator